MITDECTNDEKHSYGPYTRSIVTVRYEAGVTHELALQEARKLFTSVPTISYGPPIITVKTTTIQQTQVTLE